MVPESCQRSRETNLTIPDGSGHIARIEIAKKRAILDVPRERHRSSCNAIQKYGSHDFQNLKRIEVLRFD